MDETNISHKFFAILNEMGFPYLKKDLILKQKIHKNKNLEQELIFHKSFKQIITEEWI